MASKKTFYVTTPIYYSTDIPHVGHAYTTLAGDILARWNSLLGKDVFFLVGTDEHGKKIELAAQKANKSPKTFVDHLIPKFKEAWSSLNIKYNRFIRTTDSDHEQVVQTILSEVHKKKDIYEGYYEGYYCTGCEAYYTETDTPDLICQIHKKPLDKLKEESYFFKLSKYQKKLLDFYKKNPDFISPESRKQEIINRVKEGLQDLSISRTSFNWGIPLPFDKNHIAYVWFDALLNYISGIGYLQNTKQFKKFWPADVHLVGKDILWFHAVIWPAILFSAGIETPKKIFAHGWWSFNKEKISKSSGKFINVQELVDIAGADSARYFLFREMPFGHDGDFSEKSLVERHNNELANKLGNLVSRVSTLAETYGLQKIEDITFVINEESFIKKKEKLIENINILLDNLEFDKALNEIFSFIDYCNICIQMTKPWEEEIFIIGKKDRKEQKINRKQILYIICEGIKDIAILLSPFIPETSEKISKVFNFEISFDALNKPLEISKIKKAPILFKKIDIKDNKTNVSHLNNKDKQNSVTDNNKVITTDNKNINKSPNIEGIMTTIDFKDWEKIELRVGKIEKAEDIEGADKLYKLTISLGSEKRTICAGLKNHYKKQALEGKKCIIFVNLAPRKMKGIESQGMLLAAVSDDESQVILIQPEKDIKEGSKIR